MKSGTKPTYTQRKVIEKENLDTYDYLVIKMVGPTGFLLLSKSTNEQVVVYSDRRGVFKPDGVTPIS